MSIKKCVGVILYNEKNEIFLMTSPKWRGYIVPGGEIKKDESEEEALRREIREELGIEISDLVRVGEKEKPESSDFKDSTVRFHFIDFFARALQTKITPSDEILECGWFSIDKAFKLPLLDSTRNLLNEYAKYRKKLVK